MLQNGFPLKQRVSEGDMYPQWGPGRSPSRRTILVHARMHVN